MASKDELRWPREVTGDVAWAEYGRRVYTTARTQRDALARGQAVPRFDRSSVITMAWEMDLLSWPDESEHVEVLQRRINELESTVARLVVAAQRKTRRIHDDE